MRHPELLFISTHYLGPISASDAADMGRPELAGTYAYHVEWDDLPGVPVGVRGDRIRPV